MKLFEITTNGTKFLVVAEDVQRVTEVYTPEEIKLLSGNVTVLRARDGGAYDSDEIKNLRRVLQTALDSEEKHYESEDTKSGWMMEAKDLLQ